MLDYSKAIFESSRDAILVHRADTTILEANEAAGALLGYRREDLIGRKISDFSDTHKPLSERHMEELKVQGHTIFDRVVVRRMAYASRSRCRIRS